jgi:hypothetical protein
MAVAVIVVFVAVRWSLSGAKRHEKARYVKRSAVTR